MLDKTVEYYGIVMTREKQPVIEYKLPEGYNFQMYKPGDEISWADIEVSVEEFKTTKSALDYFYKEYTDITELQKRCFFVVDPKGHKIATANAWLGTLMGEALPRVHWIGVQPDHQGKGLCKAMVSKVLKLYEQFGEDDKVFLTSQTWSYKAINIYKQLGFIAFDDLKKGEQQGSMGEFKCDFEKSWSIINNMIDIYNN